MYAVAMRQITVFLEILSYKAERPTEKSAQVLNLNGPGPPVATEYSAVFAAEPGGAPESASPVNEVFVKFP